MPDFDNFLDSLQSGDPVKAKQDHSVRCANCGAPNSPTAIVCAECGNAVSKQLTGFTVNKGVFARESQPAYVRPAQPPAIRPQSPQKANLPYRDGFQPQPDLPYYNGNVRSAPQRPVTPYLTPEPVIRPPYYNNGAPAASPYPTPPAYSAPVRPAPPVYRPSYASPYPNGQAQTQTSPPYEVIIPERTAPGWAPEYTEVPPVLPLSPAVPPVTLPTDPQIIVQAHPAAEPAPLEILFAPAEEVPSQEEEYISREVSAEEAALSDLDEELPVTEEEAVSEPEEQDEYEPEPEAEFEQPYEEPSGGSYADRINRYKEQLRAAFDKEKPKEEKKRSNPYRAEFAQSDKGEEDRQPAEHKEAELTWKNIPLNGSSAARTRKPPSRATAGQSSGAAGMRTGTKENPEPLRINPSDRVSNTVRSHGSEAVQPDTSYQVTILNRKESERAVTEKAAPKQPQPEPQRPKKTTRSQPEQSPFADGGAGSAAEDMGTKLAQMWAAYQQQLMNGAFPGGQPVMVPPQMQSFVQMQGFPGMQGIQPLGLQAGMMPTGVPVPMYVVMSPNGGMMMYHMSPGMMPPMLPQTGDTSGAVQTAPAMRTIADSETLRKIREHERYDGRYLAYMDFSKDKYLRWEHIRFAENIVGVKYPAEFDMENADFMGKDISFSDFSLVPFLKWRQIKRSNSLKGIIYPREFNIDRADFTGRDISQSDFSQLRFLRWKHLQPAEKIKGIVYPADFDIERADFSGRDISFSDFTRVEDLRWKHLRTAASIRGIEYPSDFNIERAEFFDRDISFSDFTRVSSFRWQHVMNTYRIYGLAYPASFDIENADYSGRNIAYSDFSKVSGLTFGHIRLAQKINGIVYPNTFNMQRTDFRGRDISYSDFSLVKNMRFEHVAGASDIKGLIYPPSFDLESADFRGFDMRDSDFSLLPVYKKAYLERVSGENIIPPSAGTVIR